MVVVAYWCKRIRFHIVTDYTRLRWNLWINYFIFNANVNHNKAKLQEMIIPIIFFCTEIFRQEFNSNTFVGEYLKKINGWHNTPLNKQE